MKIGIIGIGLMGGSFALDFRSIYKNSKIYGFDVDIKNFKYSIENKIVTMKNVLFEKQLKTLKTLKSEKQISKTPATENLLQIRTGKLLEKKKIRSFSYYSGKGIIFM